MVYPSSHYHVFLERACFTLLIWGIPRTHFKLRILKFLELVLAYLSQIPGTWWHLTWLARNGKLHILERLT